METQEVKTVNDFVSRLKKMISSSPFDPKAFNDSVSEFRDKIDLIEAEVQQLGAELDALIPNPGM